MERVRNKLKGWKAKFLNHAGKEVLIKAVVQTIMAYVMQCFLLPSNFCDELCSIVGRFWSYDESKLENLFSNEEVKAIMSIPIGGPLVKDSLIWAASIDGGYSVRSGKSCTDPSPRVALIENKGLWRSIWGLKVLSKIRSFMWKLCHNIVPTKGILARRFHGAFRASDCCPRCGNEVESIEHLVFFCPFAQDVWRASSFSYSPSPLGFPGFSKWWEKIFEFRNFGNFEDGSALIAFLLWAMWKSRNGFVFEGMLDSPWDVWNRAESAFMEFSCAQSKDQRNNSPPQPKLSTWSPPLAGITKICCDAAFNKLTGKAAAAAVAHDSTEAIVHGNTIRFLASSASSAEASAIRIGFSLALNVGLENVIFESDCLGVVNRLNSGVLSAWESAAIEEDILSMASLFSSFSFSFIPRACNRVVDWVAKNALNLSCPVNWVNNVPPGLRPFL
ncbi:hypothetical protein GQ457_09G012260 [Hibiscus cannabinus]